MSVGCLHRELPHTWASAVLQDRSYLTREYAYSDTCRPLLTAGYFQCPGPTGRALCSSCTCLFRRFVVLQEYQVVRSRMIDLILATDMKMHFESLSKFRLRRNSPEFCKTNEEDLW